MRSYPRWRDPLAILRAWIVAVLIVASFAGSLAWLRIDPNRVMRGFAQIGEFAARAFPPDLATLWRLGPAVVDTLQIGIVGTALGIVLSLVLGAFAARNLTPHPALSFLLKAAFGLTRAIPALVWALLFIVAVGLGPLPGILALAVNSIGMLGKIFAETFEEVDSGVIEALRSTGARLGQVFREGIVPETLPTLISWSIFRLDINIRYASILGIVGAGGIGWELARSARMGDFPATITVTLVIFALVWTVELASNALRRLID